MNSFTQKISFLVGFLFKVKNFSSNFFVVHVIHECILHTRLNEDILNKTGLVSKPEDIIKNSVQFWPDEFAELGVIQTHQYIGVLPYTTHKVTELDKQVKGLWSGDRGVSHPRHCVLFQPNSVRRRLMLQRQDILIQRNSELKFHDLILYLAMSGVNVCWLFNILQCTISM